MLTTSLVDLFCGALGGAATIAVGQPMDTVKVRLQTSPARMYRGAIHCLAETAKSKGIRLGLYAGTSPALAACVTETAVMFAAFGHGQVIVAAIIGRRREDLRQVRGWGKKRRARANEVVGE